VLSVVLAFAALGQCGPRGCVPGGGLPSMPFFMPPPVYVQPPPVQQPVVGQQIGPPISDGKANGKLLRVEIEHGDGSRWWYTFAPPVDATVILDPKNSNAALSVEFPGDRKGRHPVPPTKPLKECKNGECCCEDCKCNPCHCGNEKTPATPNPIEQVLEDATIPNYGLDVAKIRSAAKEFEYSLSGRKCTKKQALEAIASAGDGLLDDSAHLRLSCIGTKEECQPIMDDVANKPQFKGLNFTFQAYRPDDPMIKDIGVQPGKPAVYLQQPDGKVLARWESYVGAEQVAGEIRKRDPNYDPNKDPRPDKPAPIVPDLSAIDLKAFLAKLPGWVWAVAVFFGMSFLNKSPVKV
jgi:hypothetical protein